MIGTYGGRSRAQRPDRRGRVCPSCLVFSSTLRLFLMKIAQLFSSDPRDRLRVDAQRLVALSTTELAEGFAAGENNPLEED